MVVHAIKHFLKDLKIDLLPYQEEMLMNLYEHRNTPQHIIVVDGGDMCPTCKKLITGWSKDSRCLRCSQLLKPPKPKKKVGNNPYGRAGKTGKRGCKPKVDIFDKYIL